MPRLPASGFIPPCLPIRADQVPCGPQWCYEIRRLPLPGPPRRRPHARVQPARPRLDRAGAVHRRSRRPATHPHG